MYYLCVQNLGVERCIHHSEEDVYADGMSFSCTPGFGFPESEFVKEVKIRCTEVPETVLVARVYCD